MKKIIGDGLELFKGGNAMYGFFGMLVTNMFSLLLIELGKRALKNLPDAVQFAADVWKALVHRFKR